MSGWIKLYRQVRRNPLFREKRKFSKFEAWVDMLLEANHCDKEVLLGNELITVSRGSFITSEQKLANRWRWSRTKIRSFLKLLSNEGDPMIVKKSDSKKTTITIVNYDIYQDTETAKRQQKDNEKTAKKQRKNTTKNDKNVKNDKNDKKGKEKNTKKETYFPHDEKLNQAFLDFMEMRKKIKAPMTERAITMMINKINKHDNDTAIQMLENSIINNWKDIYPLKGKKSSFDEFQELGKEWLSERTGIYENS